MIAIKHFQMNKISSFNNPLGAYVPLNKSSKPTKLNFGIKGSMKS